MIFSNEGVQKFKLSEGFLAEYVSKPVPWGFGVLSYIVYKRTYARPVEGENRTEEWWETCRRVIEGMYTVQKIHCRNLGLHWDNRKAQGSAREAYDRLFNLLWTPPGRGLWCMGADFIYERGSAALNNCAFASTENLQEDPAEPFRWLFNMSMYGVGVGFDVLGKDKVKVVEPRVSDEVYVVADTKEGWGDAIYTLISAYTGRCALPREWDFTKIREEGTPLKTFGGIAPGPQPLIDCLRDIEGVLKARVGQKVQEEDIVDIANLCGRAVVSGGVRRSSEIALGKTDNFASLKRDQEKLSAWRWASNNSIVVEDGDVVDYEKHCENIAVNGEPGFFWLDNSRNYGRMKDPKNQKDYRAKGTNPCQPGFAKLIIKGKGLSTFDNLSIGDEIWSETGWTKVVNKWSTGVKPVYSYRTNSGEFIGTENHRVVQNGVKVEASRAKAIDSLVCKDECASSGYNISMIMDGLVIGDGGRAPARCIDDIILYIGQDDYDYFDSEISQLIKGRHVNGGHTDYAVKTSITSGELFSMPDRCIPDRILINISAVDAASLLRGLYSANGSVVANGRRVTLKSTSKKLVSQIQNLLSFVGIQSYITTNSPSSVEWPNGTYESKESYDINITGDRFVFLKKIGFLQKYKCDKISGSVSKRRKSTFEIVDVEYLGDMEVFDITVDNAPHTYWTGGVNVSNCSEQTLEDHELCTLVESYPARHSSLEDFKRTMKFAYLYAKTVSLIPTHDPKTNAVMQRNNRIGASMSGIVQNIYKIGLENHIKWCDETYNYIQDLDKIYSEWLCRPRSIKTTSVKPSGTVSLLSGASPGIHHFYGQYMIRRVEISASQDIWRKAQEAGYVVEDSAYKGSSTKVVEVPIYDEYMPRTCADVTMWEQMSLLAIHQKYWADNQVSITVTFKDHEAKDIPMALRMYADQIKSVSFLPYSDHGYVQAPYEPISKEVYEERIANIREIDWSNSAITHDQDDKFCDGEACLIPQK